MLTSFKDYDDMSKDTNVDFIIQFHKGEVGDLQDMMDALSTLRLIGLEDTARRAILHHLIVNQNE